MKISHTTAGPSRLGRLIAYGCGLIIAVAPFHAFLTVWAASLVGHYTALRLWKEVLLVALVIASIALLMSQTYLRPAVLSRLRQQPIIYIVAAYLLLLIVTGLVALGNDSVNLKAFGDGLLLDGRFVVFFGITWLVGRSDGWLVEHWRQLLIIPLALVVGFGLLQFTVLPTNFLQHFGYGPGTIAAVQTVDQKASYQRIQSTLRGANPLGAYLIIGVVASSLLLARARMRRWARILWVLLLAACFAVLGLTFSRSAWLGAAASLGWLVWQAIRSSQTRRLVGLVAVVAVVGLPV